MRWHTATTHSSKIAPKVTIETMPNPAHPSEIKIDFGGLGVYLSKQEAADLCIAIDAAIVRDAALANGEPDER